ncbi:hypothetical protein SAMN04490248_11732 [Salinihabitans flavidus]|uniref:Uncharacterized protein n=1 Tax=Salinihabitans flavidus TaxID=569882 RepID=A0A1H8TWF3_9RHOB|nr:hypothetical protein [Salinihabitans flavidus]SEO95352.1 hypothetical protein SAMN04490248_11732 [Salinihabitans flavidus]
MTGDVTETPEKESVKITLGCEPRIIVTVTETDGNLMFSLAPEDPDAEMPDLDGFFFNVTDESKLDTLTVFPSVNVENSDGLKVTGYEAEADSADSLSNGATLTEQYDVGVQFGTTDDSTEGEVNEIAFTLYSGGNLSLDDIDLESFAAVINSDTEDGLVLTTNDELNEGEIESFEGDSNDDGDKEDPDTCAFTVEGEVNVEVIMSELEDGSIQFDLSVLQGDDPDATGSIGDLRGLFFDVADEGILEGLTITGDDVTRSEFEADGVTNLGQGNNLNGEIVNENGAFDGGVSFGTPGAGKDDIQETSFILSHPDGLSLADFEGQDIGLRLTSVGEEGGDRDGSLKLIGQCPPGGDDPKDPECEYQYELEDVMKLMTMEESEDDSAPEEDEDDGPGGPPAHVRAMLEEHGVFA